jgi:hypothetical protein
MRHRRRRRSVRFEFKQLVIDTSNKQSIPDLSEYFSDEHGWYVDTEITCPPIVILILSRETDCEFTEEELNDD